MDYRKHEIFSGKVFKVPKYIVRLDSEKTHGWQVRYGTWKLFSDHTNDGSGAAAALKLATVALAERIAKFPAPTGLRVTVREGKGNGMPLGISGPVARTRPGRSGTQYYLQVTYPVPGAKPVNRSVYIATENTLSREKYKAAMAKAVALRTSGVRKFKLATTKRVREQAATARLGQAKQAK